VLASVSAPRVEEVRSKQARHSAVGCGVLRRRISYGKPPSASGDNRRGITCGRSEPVSVKNYPIQHGIGRVLILVRLAGRGNGAGEGEGLRPVSNEPRADEGSKGVKL
jgi:hypothetical protein